ncbi:hypothetical protein EDM76_12840, partial [bacterium]
ARIAQGHARAVAGDLSGLRVTYAGGSGANAWSETVNTFDSRGNMTRREKTYWNGSATVTDTDVRDDASWSAGDRINDLNQVKKRIVTPAGGSATTWTFSYDANGRMTSKSDGTNTWTYTWDPDEPRLTRVQGPGGVDVSYTYCSMGRMLTRTSGGVTTTFEWDGWTMVKETTGSVVTRYIAPQGQIHSFERGGQVYQVHSDAHNGSVRAITDASGAVVAHYEFDAWGAQLASSSAFSGGFSYGYVGGLGVRTDEATGLIWMRQRWYDAGLGRFLSRDALGSLNRYEYCSNDPVNWVDLDGLKPTRINTTAPGGPYWYDVVDGVPTYWNNSPLDFKRRRKDKPIPTPIIPPGKRKPCPEPFKDPIEDQSLPELPFEPHGPPSLPYRWENDPINPSNRPKPKPVPPIPIPASDPHPIKQRRDRALERDLKDKWNVNRSQGVPTMLIGLVIGGAGGYLAPGPILKGVSIVGGGTIFVGGAIQTSYELYYGN